MKNTALKTNSKAVRDQVKQHILDSIESIEVLKGNNKALQWGNKSDYQCAFEQVEGGNFLIYNSDVTDFLNGLGINPEGKEYDNVKSWELYKHLVASEIVKLIK